MARHGACKWSAEPALQPATTPALSRKGHERSHLKRCDLRRSSPPRGECRSAAGQVPLTATGRDSYTRNSDPGLRPTAVIALSLKGLELQCFTGSEARLHGPRRRAQRPARGRERPTDAQLGGPPAGAGQGNPPRRATGYRQPRVLALRRRSKAYLRRWRRGAFPRKDSCSTSGCELSTGVHLGDDKSISERVLRSATTCALPQREHELSRL